MKAHPLIAATVCIQQVRERAFVVAGLGNRHDANLMMLMTDIIEQQQIIIQALMQDAGPAYAGLQLRFASTGSVMEGKESSNG